MVRGRWVDAGDLQVGDVVLLQADREARIEAITVRPACAKVYNFEVEELHNYAVGVDWVLVHNVTPCEAAAKAARGAAAAAQAAKAQGGTYVLKNGAGKVMKTGRSKNLARRKAELARQHPDLKGETVHRTDSYAAQRGLEQMLNDKYKAPLDRIRGIDPANPRIREYLAAARRFLRS